MYSSDTNPCTSLYTIDYIHKRRRLIKTIHNGSLSFCLQSLCERTNSWVQSSIMYSSLNNALFELQRILMEIPYVDNLKIATKGRNYIQFTKGEFNKEELHIYTLVYNEETEDDDIVLVRKYLMENKYNAYSFFLFV